MGYKIREGVVFETICGQHRLIATMEARKHCPIVSALNESSAFVWRLLEEGLNENEMSRKIMDAFPDMEKTELIKLLEDFLFQLKKEGYLLSDQDENGDEAGHPL